MLRSLALAPLLLLLAACAETTTPTPTPDDREAPREDAPASTPSTPAPERRAPQAVGKPAEAASMAPLNFYVSNQSFDLATVDIDVFVDDVKVITGDFVVEGQHTWVRFDFTAATDRPHTIRAVTTKGGVQESKVVELPSAGRWVVVNFWYADPSRGTQPKSFSLDDYADQPMFD